MTDRLITSQDEFEELCDHIRESGIVAFDTEFISEHTYRPQLCLVQLATDDRCVAVDPFEVDVKSWWDIVIDDDTTVVVHAGREETRFCLTNTQTRPKKLVDIQIAEGLRSSSYPLSYERLVSRVIGKTPESGETRTDWQRRPLTDKQIRYALDDVRFVLQTWRKQRDWLERSGRLSWAFEEFERMVDEIVAERGDHKWAKLSGVRRLNPRQLAVARALFLWRRSVADEHDLPMRRVLRDDLLIDLARRQPQSESDLLRSREMNRANFKRHAAGIVECVKTAVALPKADLPKKFRSNDSGPDEPVLGKLLALALANQCVELDVSAGLVGTSSDLKDLIRWYSVGCPEDSRPRLETGWRSEVCGDLLRSVLDGKVSLRVADPGSPHPLVFEERQPDPA